MDEELRARVKGFHRKMTLVGGLILAAGGLAGAYIHFFYRGPVPPKFMVELARWFAR